eukprot:SAG31_NODE_3883_length_3786_cov_3.919989_4_plen_618_part_00
MLPARAYAARGMLFAVLVLCLLAPPWSEAADPDGVAPGLSCPKLGGEHNRATVYMWRMTSGGLTSVTLEALSLEVVVGRLLVSHQTEAAPALKQTLLDSVSKSERAFKSDDADIGQEKAAAKSAAAEPVAGDPSSGGIFGGVFQQMKTGVGGLLSKVQVAAGDGDATELPLCSQNGIKAGNQLVVTPPAVIPAVAWNLSECRVADNVTVKFAVRQAHAPGQVYRLSVADTGWHNVLSVMKKNDLHFNIGVRLPVTTERGRFLQRHGDHWVLDRDGSNGEFDRVAFRVEKRAEWLVFLDGSQDVEIDVRPVVTSKGGGDGIEDQISKLTIMLAADPEQQRLLQDLRNDLQQELLHTPVDVQRGLFHTHAQSGALNNLDLTHSFFWNNLVPAESVPAAPYCRDTISRHASVEGGLQECFILRGHPAMLRRHMPSEKFALSVADQSGRMLLKSSPVLVGVQVGEQHIGSETGFRELVVIYFLVLCVFSVLHHHLLSAAGETQANGESPLIHCSEHLNGSGAVGPYSAAAVQPGTWHSSGGAKSPKTPYVVELRVDSAKAPVGTLATVSVDVGASDQPDSIFDIVGPGTFRSQETSSEAVQRTLQEAKRALAPERKPLTPR